VQSFRKIALYAGPLLALVFTFWIDLDPAHPAVSRTAGIALWMALWWITEVVPLAVTALLPVFLFPLCGVMDGKAVAPIYFNHIIFLFVGGFMVALAMQRWNLHQRIALRILLSVGARPQGLLLGFIGATAFLSMWISNTATTMMMVPIALSIILRLEETAEREVVRRYSIGIFLGVAYGASIGGIATPVGTPPNLAFMRILHILFPAAPEISFATWLLFAFPITVVFLLVLWLLLTALFVPRPVILPLNREVFEEQYRKLGPMTHEEKVVLADFLALAVLWLSRADLRLGALTLPGWSRLFANPGYFNDGTVAVALAVVLFLIPSRRDPGKRILDWETAAKLPWNIVLLFGGGFALAQGFKTSALDQWLGHQIEGVANLPPLWIIAVICLGVTFLTELTSNTATAQMFLPILGSLAEVIRVNPLALMIPATLSCSFAFMLPVATPPNAIIFGTERLSIRDMARVGIWLNLIGVVIVTTAVFTIGKLVFGLSLTEVPAWVTAQAVAPLE
jgi:sodium-dependent dicarboxylate transporter 2/3/5